MTKEEKYTNRMLNNILESRFKIGMINKNRKK